VEGLSFWQRENPSEWTDPKCTDDLLRCSGARVHILIANVAHYQDLQGGAPKIAFDESRKFLEDGHSVTVLAPAIETLAPESETVNGVRLVRYRVPHLNLVDPRRIWCHRNAAIDALRTHVKAPVSVIHGHVPLAYLAACEVYGRGARTIYSFHSPATMEMQLNWSSGTMTEKLKRIPGLPVLRVLERKCLRKSDVLTAFSRFTRENIIRIHGGVLANRIKVLPGWVDLQRFRIISNQEETRNKIGWPKDVPVLFTLRRLVKRMGLDRLVRAAALVRDRGLKMHLVIGGSGPMRQELEDLVQELRLPERVQFAGRVSDEQVPLMYGACDAFALPTTALECFGLITVEALACGRPVLATPVGAIPEVLGQFEPKWLARSASAEDIADLITAFLKGELPSHSPGELRDKAEQLYSHKVRLDELCRLVVAGRVRGRGSRK